MGERLKAFLVKLGYSYKCKHCGVQEFHLNKLIFDVVMISLFFIAFYVYNYQEKPMLNEIRNNSYNCQYEEMKNIKSLQMNNSDPAVQNLLDHLNVTKTT